MDKCYKRQTKYEPKRIVFKKFNEEWIYKILTLSSGGYDMIFNNKLAYIIINNIN